METFGKLVSVILFSDTLALLLLLLFASVFSIAVASVEELVNFPFSVCVTNTLSPYSILIPSITGTDQVPSPETSVNALMEFLNVTCIVAPALPFPLIARSPSLTVPTTGFGVISGTVLITVISKGKLSNLFASVCVTLIT